MRIPYRARRAQAITTPFVLARADSPSVLASAPTPVLSDAASKRAAILVWRRQLEGDNSASSDSDSDGVSSDSSSISSDDEGGVQVGAGIKLSLGNRAYRLRRGRRSAPRRISGQVDDSASSQSDGASISSDDGVSSAGSNVQGLAVDATVDVGALAAARVSVGVKRFAPPLALDSRSDDGEEEDEADDEKGDGDQEDTEDEEDDTDDSSADSDSSDDSESSDDDSDDEGDDDEIKVLVPGAEGSDEIKVLVDPSAAAAQVSDEIEVLVQTPASTPCACKTVPLPTGPLADLFIKRPAVTPSNADPLVNAGSTVAARSLQVDVPVVAEPVAAFALPVNMGIGADSIPPATQSSFMLPMDSCALVALPALALALFVVASVKLHRNRRTIAHHAVTDEKQLCLSFETNSRNAAENV